MAGQQERPAEAKEGPGEDQGSGAGCQDARREEASVIDPLRQAIETKLDQMLLQRRPAMWGGPEAFELQVLLLLDLLYGAASPVSHRFHAFLQPRHGHYLGCRSLSSTTPDYDVLTTELKAFRAELRARHDSSLEAEDPPPAKQAP